MNRQRRAIRLGTVGTEAGIGSWSAMGGCVDPRHDEDHLDLLLWASAWLREDLSEERLRALAELAGTSIGDVIERLQITGADIASNAVTRE